MKFLNLVFLSIIMLSLFSCTQPKEEEVYLFSFFRGNGEDGLHLAYSNDGYSWSALKNNESFLTPMVGEDKLMRDPCIITDSKGTFHMVWTVSWKEGGIGYASSEDLIHWSEQQFIPVMAHEPTARNCWAPEVFYDSDEDIFMIYWATTIPCKFPETQVKGDAGLNHRIYYVTTKDFKTYSKTELLYDQGFNAIDAVIQKIDGQYTMFVKDETIEPTPQKNIRVSVSNQLTKGYGPASEPISDHWVEGPTAAKIGDKWIIYFDRYRQHHMGAIESSDLETWTDITEQIKFPSGTRHGTFFKAPKSVLNQLLLE